MIDRRGRLIRTRVRLWYHTYLSLLRPIRQGHNLRAYIFIYLRYAIRSSRRYEHVAVHTIRTAVQQDHT